MRAKNKVGGLTEQEAKAALAWTLGQVVMYQTAAWKKKVDMDAMQKLVLCEALKEVRE